MLLVGEPRHTVAGDADDEVGAQRVSGGALAAATASQIHLEGPGRFYYTGRDIDRLDLVLLKQFLYEMVKMSPLQSYTAEVIPEDPALAVIGAGVAALLAGGC